MGSILLHDGVLRVIAGSIIGLVGVSYGTCLAVRSGWQRCADGGVRAVALEFVPSISPPENMRDAQWDGEQV